MPSIAEAAAQQRVSTDTIRRRIADGSLPAKKIKGRWEIELDTEDAQDEATIDVQAANKVVEILEAQLENLTRELETKNHQIEQLHQLLGAKALAEGRPSQWWRLWRR